MLATFRQQCSARLLGQVLQHVQLLVESFGSAADAGIDDLCPATRLDDGYRRRPGYASTISKRSTMARPARAGVDYRLMQVGIRHVGDHFLRCRKLAGGAVLHKKQPGPPSIAYSAVETSSSRFASTSRTLPTPHQTSVAVPSVAVRQSSPRHAVHRGPLRSCFRCQHCR